MREQDQMALMARQQRGHRYQEMDLEPPVKTAQPLRSDWALQREYRAGWLDEWRARPGRLRAASA